MTNLIHTIELQVGSQGSGHRQHSIHTFSSNRTRAQVIANHNMASRMYSIRLSEQCSEYEDSCLTAEFHKRILEIFQIKPEFLAEYQLEAYEDVDGEDQGGFYLHDEQFAILYMQIANIVDPEMEWVVSRPDTSPHHIGGYGLFFA
jgi:hypothetical protein